MCWTGKNSSHVPLKDNSQRVAVHDQLKVSVDEAVSLYGCTSVTLASIMAERLLLLVVG